MSEYTEYWLSREKVWHISGTWVSCNLLCRHLVDSTVKHSTFILVMISRISHICRVFRHSGPPLLQESYIFVQRRRFRMTCKFRLFIVVCAPILFPFTLPANQVIQIPKPRNCPKSLREVALLMASLTISGLKPFCTETSLKKGGKRTSDSIRKQWMKNHFVNFHLFIFI